MTDSREPSGPIFWEHEGNRAVLEGSWKLVALSGQPWRLYDTAADRTEQHDLASAQPDRAKALAAKWDAYAARANVLPLGGWQATGVRKKGKAKAAGASFSKQTRFQLKMGDHLARSESPAVVGRGLTITAKFNSSEADGVIVAQGGVAHGYTLFLKEGKLNFLVRAGGLAASIATSGRVSGEHTAVARLQQDGAISLVMDGQTRRAGQSTRPAHHDANRWAGCRLRHRGFGGTVRREQHLPRRN